ncbi:MAG TPA: murein biosynthesis integral membrane protein MurJ [Armatimonadetes bacterium]|nr:murein biosynthesis integral membrane protein MurJ [Armatimonadota bacterium]
MGFNLPHVSETPATPNVARAGGIMMLSLFLSRVLGIVRDTVMSAQFGINEMTGAYRLAFQIPDLLFFLIAGGALSSAFIPVFSQYLHTDREEEAWHVFSVVATLMSIVVLAFIAVAWVYALPLTHLVAPSPKVDHLRPLIAQMSRIVLPAQFAFFIGGLMVGTLYARQKFVVPGLGPNVYNLGIIFGAIVLSRFFDPGIVGMSVGALAGAVLGSFVLPMVAMRRIGARYRPSLDLRHPGVRKVFALMAPVVLGLSLPGVYGMIMQALGTAYGAGTNAALDLSNKLMQAPLGVFGQSLALAVFPTLSQYYAQDRMDSYRAQLASTLRTIVYMTLPIAAFMVVLAPEIVHLFFAYGKGAGSENLRTVADLLRMFAIGITAWCLHPVLMRGFFAIHNSLTPILLGTATTALFVVLALALSATPLRHLGLPLASSVAALALVVALAWALAPRIGGLDHRSVLGTTAGSIAGSAAMAAALALLQAFLPEGIGLGRNLWAAAKLGLGAAAGFWIYYAATRALGMRESETLARYLRRLERRKPKGNCED